MRVTKEKLKGEKMELKLQGVKLDTKDLDRLKLRGIKVSTLCRILIKKYLKGEITGVLEESKVVVTAIK